METHGQGRPDGMITADVLILEDLGSITVSPLADYNPAEFFAVGINRWGVNAWCSKNFASIVKLAEEEDDVSFPCQTHHWDTINRVIDAQIIQAYGGFIFKSVTRALWILASLVHQQANGQKGVLLTNAGGNVVHVQIGDQVWWLAAVWYPARLVWHFCASTLSASWGPGHQFLSDDSAASPL